MVATIFAIDIAAIGIAVVSICIDVLGAVGLLPKSGQQRTSFGFAS